MVNANIVPLIGAKLVDKLSRSQVERWAQGAGSYTAPEATKRPRGANISPTLATSRTLLWLAYRWECRNRRPSTGEEIFVFGQRTDTGGIGIGPCRVLCLQSVGAGHAQVRECSRLAVPHHAVAVKDLLELDCSHRTLARRQIVF
jgi:hypothetical protein